MGTISDKLMRIINTKEDIRQALISKGYDVPTSIPFKEYAKMISDLPCRVDSFPDIEGIVARYSALGLTNEQMAANPVWVDKTGNGHDIQLKNFSWKGTSGVGGYEMNFNLWRNNVSSIPDISMSTTTTSVSVSVENSTYNNNLIYIHISNWDINKNHWLKVTSTYEDGDLAFVFYDNSNTKKIGLPANGYVNILAYPEFKGSYMYISTTSNKQGSFTIEQLPLYPGALVFDGVDDYGTCDNFPILTKEKGYTVVALRQWITRGKGALGLVSNVKNWLKDGAFLLEYRNIQADHLNKPISFGAIGSENDLPHILTYQTSKSYNGVSITTGNFEGTDVLHVGKLAPTNVGTCINAAIWELVFLDHDATEEELTKIKDYFVKTYPWLFPDQAWTVVGKTNEDEDRATIANITGNGNDLVLSNFGFAEGSGYGLYKTPFELYPSVQHSSKYSLSFSKFALGDHNLIIAPKQNDLSYDIKVKVTGLKEGVKFKWGWIDTTGYIDITTDGIHMLNKPASQIRQLIVEFAEDFDPDHVVTIEQIPEYEGYLMTDGVDDKAVSKQFKIGENFTVILDFKFPVKKISYCGFDLSSKVRIQNLQGRGVYVVLKGNKTLIPSNVVRAVTSEGKVYDENWNEYNIVPGNVSSNYTMVNLGFDGSNQFAESATKLAGIYSSTLSKDDCIKAYNYLQTLKAK
jgi:hypothetical protein|nr:MAG TPA: hypothetical protein [Caudoviricetes sp.]